MIRKATESDLKAIMAINDAVQMSPWSKTAVESELSHAEFIGFVHENNSKKIDGYLLSRRHCDGADLMMIGVAGDAQGQGVGHRLMEAFFEALKSIFGEAQVFLEVSHRNQKAISFYKALGFETYLIRKAYYPDNADALCMKLVLAKTQ